MSNYKLQPNVPAKNFAEIVSVNVDNTKLSDTQFREFIRNTLPIVIYDRPEDED